MATHRRRHRTWKNMRSGSCRLGLSHKINQLNLFNFWRLSRHALQKNMELSLFRRGDSSIIFSKLRFSWTKKNRREPLKENWPPQPVIQLPAEKTFDYFVISDLEICKPDQSTAAPKTASIKHAANASHLISRTAASGHCAGRSIAHPTWLHQLQAPKQTAQIRSAQ